MPVEIGPFDPSTASAADLAQQYGVVTAVMTLDYPGQSVSSLEEHTELIRVPVTSLGPIRRWVARQDGRIIGHASAICPEHENRQLAIVRVIVAPTRWRQGIGTVLLRAILPELGADGRSVVVGHSVKADASGEAWARELGFVRTHAYVRQRLRVADADPARWQHPVAEGFRLERWTGAAPESLLAEYARARTAIADAPRGESAMAFKDWTPARVRAHEANLAARNCDNHVVVAVHEPSGEVAAVTELGIRVAQPTLGLQADTAVVAGFRGRGLGLAVKGAMLRWLTADRPALAEVFTQTAQDNVHMIRINHAVGYATMSVHAELEAGTAELAQRLAA